MILAMLLLAGAPDAPPACGTAVVGSYFPTIPLRDVDGKVLDVLKVDKGKLQQELPVIRCSASLVLVRWKGGQAAVDRARVRFAQPMVVCPEGAVAGTAENQGNASTIAKAKAWSIGIHGTTENQGSASSMGAFDPRCPQPRARKVGGK